VVSEGNELSSGPAVVLADDEIPTRTEVRTALESSGFRVVAETSTASGAVEAALAHRPDVCLLAVNMEGNGIVAAVRICSALPETKVVMLTASDREDDLFAALRAGAQGYLLKSTSPERLPHAVRGVLDGEAALPRGLTARLIREYRDPVRRRQLPFLVSGKCIELTTREFEVLDHLRRGEPTAAIAEQLRISEVTVRRHISAILGTLGAPDRRTALELLARAEDAGLENLCSA
jgi:DNA-binding NarL/FixJ family response regulator